MDNKPQLLFGKKNFTFVLAGLVCIVIGMVLMLGGGNAPDLTKTYPEATLYGTQRTLSAPFLILVGFGLQIVAIFTQNKPAE